MVRYDHEVVPLLTPCDLADEATDMTNCVRIYVRRCLTGISRIFSIRYRGDPLATFELVRRDDGWQIAQIRGRRNLPPRPLDRLIAEDTVRRYRRAEMNCSRAGAIRGAPR